MKRKKITREFREKVVKEYMESGESAKTIARKYGISEMSVLNWMKKIPETADRKGFTKEEKEEAVLYRMQGNTLQETANKYDVSEVSIRNWEKEFGVNQNSRRKPMMKKEKHTVLRGRKRVVWIRCGAGAGYYGYKYC